MEKNYLKTSDGAYLYYEVSGEGEDTILFVPGHMCTTKFFQKNVDYLKRKHRVVTMDSRGFGNSSKPLHGNCIERHANDIRELILHLDLDRVVLSGWSLSGSVVTTYAHKYACDRLKGLVLLDCCLFPFSPEDWNSYNSKNYNMDDWNRKYRLWYTDTERYINNFVARMEDGLSVEEVAMVREEIGKTPPWIGFALHSDWCHTNCVPMLRELTVPAIIFSGESLGHRATMGEHYASLIPTYCEHHVFASGGHVLFMAEAETFNQKLEDFIARISA